MENEELKIDKAKEPLLDKILGIVAAAAFIAIAICGICESGTGLFISIAAAFTLSLCIIPLTEYIRKAPLRDRRENLLQAAGIGFTITIAGSLIFLAQRVIFSKAITRDRYYWVYDYIAWYLIISFILVKIMDTVKRIKSLMRENAGLLRYIGSAAYSVIFILFVFVIPVSRYYVPKNVIDLSSIEKPGKFIYFQSSESRTEELNNKLSFSGTIEDDKLAELFQIEMSKVKTENIRMLDLINFEMKNTKATYLVLSPVYNEKGDGIQSASGTGGRYIDQIRIYENGEVVLYDFDLNSIRQIFRQPVSLFRLNPSTELIDEIDRAINENQKQ